MKLFINDNPLSVKKLSEIKDLSEYEVIIQQDEKIDYQKFKNELYSTEKPHINPLGKISLIKIPVKDLENRFNSQ